MKKAIVFLCFFGGAACFISAGLYINKNNAGMINTTQESVQKVKSPELLSDINMTQYVSLPASFSDIDIVEDLDNIEVTEDISRMIEMTVRVSVAPVVAGLSFFGNGADMDFVRFVKRTLGLFFQIIVILIICASITFVHNALVVTDENAHKSVNTVVDPAVKLKGSYTADYPEIEIRNMQTTKKQSVAEDKKIEYTSVETSREWKKAEKRTVKKEVTDNDHEDDDENGGTSEAYAKDDFKYFVNHIVDPSTFFISTGIMLSALFLIFRSREISTKLFA